MKKNSIAVLVFTLILFLTGCDSSNDTNLGTKYSTDGLNHITCSRDAEASDENTDVEIKYDLYYDDNDYLKVLKSVEKITSSNGEVINKYKEAYEKVYSVYNDIDYYDNNIVVQDNTITSTTSINYGKIDMDKLLEIEGKEDNVKVENGKIKLSDWKSFAKKYGTTCN